ncbi:circadian clock-controlled protein daywake [Anastrepha obliqua]|uniref:circadian clock-controlled protein daywake n=1 Tax=Anastrepha obliqua TaxID=95512 RepID=UPI0024098636|nr:circadian clock-controlled protein daywake [Anastrepha obliqua]
MRANLCSLTFLLALTLQITYTTSKHLAERPSFLNPCDYNGATFDKCFADNFQLLFSHWQDGIPGLKSLGSLDPLSIKRIKIQQDSGAALNIVAELENMLVYNASKAIVKKAILDKSTFEVDATLELPVLYAEGDYKVKGTVLGLNINGAGKCNLEAGRIRLNFHLATKLRDEGDLTFSDIVSLKAKILEIGDFHIDVQNLFGGQRDLEATANDLFNQNWRELFGILSPTLEQTLELVLKDRFTKIYAYVPATYFISNMPRASEFYG